jgi:hypothetical protein
MKILLFRHATATPIYILDIHIYMCIIGVAYRFKALHTVACATVGSRCRCCVCNGANATLNILIISNLKHIVARCKGMQQMQRMNKGNFSQVRGSTFGIVTPWGGFFAFTSPRSFLQQVYNTATL